MSDHVLKVELGEITNYLLVCNLDNAAQCHQVCSTHPEGGCGDPDTEGECANTVNESGCVIAEWVDDGGIESVGFEHTLELPVNYYWDGGHDCPSLVVLAEPQRVMVECPTNHRHDVEKYSPPLVKGLLTQKHEMVLYASPFCPDCGSALDGVE